MEYSELTRDERLVLVALLDLVIRADDRFSEEEAAEVERISASLGSEVYNATAVKARARLATMDDIQKAALALDRQEARELILTAVQDMAVVDEVSQEEMQLVEWLSGLWG